MGGRREGRKGGREDEERGGEDLERWLLAWVTVTSLLKRRKEAERERRREGGVFFKSLV